MLLIWSTCEQLLILCGQRCNQSSAHSARVNTHRGNDTASLPLRDKDKHCLLPSCTPTLSPLAHLCCDSECVLKLRACFLVWAPSRLVQSLHMGLVTLSANAHSNPHARTRHLFRVECSLICRCSSENTAPERATLLHCSNLHSWPFHWDKPPLRCCCLHNTPNHPSAKEQFSLVCFCPLAGLLCFCSSFKSARNPTATFESWNTSFFSSF